MENVPTIQKSPKLVEVLSIFKACGYGISRRVLNACYCGVPQARKRYIVIGALGEDDGFLDKILESHLSDKPMTLYDYFGDTLA